MMCYKDMTFCSYWKECIKGKECSRALTPEVIDAAKKWMKEAPICQFVNRPTCFKLNIGEQGRRFCCGDIHGGYKALLQVLERSGFDKEKDILIQLGDIADGWSQTYECMEELLTIKNLIPIRGNHDTWLLDWLETGNSPNIWTQQGGLATIESYKQASTAAKLRHINFLKSQSMYIIDEDNNAFIHGGYTSIEGLGHECHIDDYTWDRDLIYRAMASRKNDVLPKFLRMYKKVFIGHTSTLKWKTSEPLKACNVWDLDTGAGYLGKLTIMNIDTEEYFQSDFVKDLYPNEFARR